MDKKTIWIDFDGVIHSYTSGWKGVDQIPDPPVEGAMMWLWEMVETFNVCICSTRNADQMGIDAMVRWIDRYGEQARLLMVPMPKDRLSSLLEFPIEKPPAILGIDDRVFQFAGRFPSSQEILDFKPWYQIQPNDKMTDSQRADRLEMIIDRMSGQLADCRLLLKPIRELCYQIEALGASPELTNTVVAAGEIYNNLKKALSVNSET